MLIKWRIFAITALAASLAACASPKVEMAYNGISSPQVAAAKTFMLISNAPDFGKSDLQFQEYAAYVVRGLAEQGLTPAPAGTKPDLGIILSYGTGKPERHTGSYSVPTWGQTGVASSTTTGTVSASGNYSGTTTYTPQYGVTGSEQYTYEYTTYARYIKLEGFFTAKQPFDPAFTTTIASVGSSADMREIFPVMIAGVSPRLIGDSGHMQDVAISTTDPHILAIKGVVKQEDSGLLGKIF